MSPLMNFGLDAANGIARYHLECQSVPCRSSHKDLHAFAKMARREESSSVLRLDFVGVAEVNWTETSLMVPPNRFNLDTEVLGTFFLRSNGCVYFRLLGSQL